ncbi:PREDICTED: protein LAZY 1-like isoform X2 [Lupinus angustifolius]|uniref:protein LAZY 1-like isoform X2 n=1 Tax=Lupinus angustifolius TaxID=3871 RepID=UPI00092E4722|nr:PREDICTED: protein LAZY 1-like isoform X2 [Lupinus angustifolius]
MKLLGWMHRKFRQNSTEQFKYLFIGQPSQDDEQSYMKQTNTNTGMKLFKQNQKSQNLRNSFGGLEASKVDEDYYEGESEAGSMCDIFPGFLAIGTLGSDQVISDPSATPTFALSFGNITEKEDEVTQNDLKLINDELEKVLVAETNNDDVSIDSSGRNSIVSNGRSSHVSIITLSGKPLMEARVSNMNETAICPLQEYLFGTVVEHSETTTTTKKEHRTSLGELFQKSKMVEENNFGAKVEKEEKRNEREAEKSAINFMKEKLKKRMLHGSSRNSTSGNGGHADFASAETKLNKILHMFRKKVHPQSSTATQKSSKQRKNEYKKRIMNDGIYNRGDLVHPEEYSFGNREHWIKTDADYLVLEL